MAQVGRPLKFKTEKEFIDYLILNAEFWVDDLLNSNIKNIDREWYLVKMKSFGANKPRIDLSITTNDNRRIGVEVKNPKNIFGELSRTISQLLSYAVLAEENGNPFDELVIITSEYDDILIKVIKKYKLPIRIFLIDKQFHCEII